MLPDESTLIPLTIDIDDEMAAELNQFRPKMEATLILHVELGKEHFIPVSATYGMSLRSAVSRGLGVCACVEGFTRASIA